MDSPVALLVVHGIGRQPKGATLGGLVAGLRQNCDGQLAVVRNADDHAEIVGAGRAVHVFEVHWADLLEGETVKGTFDADRIFESVWFPLLNLRSGQLPAHTNAPWRVRAWTTALAVLSPLLAAGVIGARFVTIVPTVIARHRPLSEAARARADHGGGFWARAMAKANDPEVRRTIVDDLMDQVAGDVFNYAHGLRRAFPGDSPRNDELARRVAEIQPRFERAAARAVEAGCREIHVLAHSLGTVIAFVAMSSDAVGRATMSEPARLSRFYTIGSPLEKIRFFWPALVAPPARGPAIVAGDRVVAAAPFGSDGRPAMRWDNFHSRFDLVSGALGPFEGWPQPVNHQARGLGGLITSHVAYNRSPAFLAFLGEALTGVPAPVARVAASGRAAHGTSVALETLALPALLGGLSAFGLAVIGVMGWAAGSLWGWPLRWVGLDAWADGVRLYFVASMLFVSTVVAVLLGRSRARDAHARHCCRNAGATEA
jgi:hypothetical protein